MSELLLTTVDRPVLTYEETKLGIATTENVKFVSVSSINDSLNVITENNVLMLENTKPLNVTTTSVTTTISITESSSDNAIVELLVKDIIASNPSILSGSSSAKIENLMVYFDSEKDSYYVTTTSEIEGELLTLLINYNDESIEVIGNMNIIGKQRVEFKSDVDFTYKYARVTYIKKA